MLEAVSLRKLQGKLMRLLRSVTVVAVFCTGFMLGSSGVLAGPANQQDPQAASSLREEPRDGSDEGAEAGAEESAADEAAETDAAAGSLASATEKRTELNLLGEVDASSGESRRNENVPIDLIDNNVLKELNTRLGTTATIVREFRVESDYFGAEYGGSPKTPPHLAPSVVPPFRGQLYALHGNSVFSSRSFFQVGDVKPAHDNDYGFVLGLPVWQNANFTVDARQQRVRGNVNGNVLVPRADERTPLTNDPERRAIVERMLAAYPDELPNRTDIDERALNTNSPQQIDSDQIGARLDQPWGDKDRLVLGYSLTLQKVDAFQLVAGQNPDTTTRAHDARTTWSRAWSPDTTTDVSAGLERVGSLLVADENAFGPLTSVGSVLTHLGPSSNIPIDRAQNRFRYGGLLHKTQGRHQWSAGAEVDRQQINGLETSSHSGQYAFRNDFGRDALTNFLLGTPSTYFAAVGNVHRGFRNWGMQYYLGDNWRPHDRLTLALGIRYQPVTSPVEVNNLSEVPYSCDCNNLAPRFGFAYRLGEAWGVLRGAYGIHYGEIFPVTFGQARFNPPGSIRVFVPEPNLVDPLGDLPPGGFHPDARSSFFELSPDLITPYSHQYNFSWELRLRGDWNLQLGYVGSRTIKLLAQWFQNRAQPVPGIPLTIATTNKRRADERYFDVRTVLNGSRAYYDAAKAELTIPRWSGLTMSASYWFSKAIDLGSNYTNTGSGLDGSQGRGQTEFEVHRDVKAVSNFDQPHAALWQVVYQTPGLVTQRGWLRNTLGGWELFTVVLLKSGTPFSLRSGSDGPGFGNVDGASGDRPHVLDPSILGRSIDHPDTSTERLPFSAFAFMSPEDRAGSLGRNTFRKDGIQNINAAVSRRWPVGAEKTLVLRAESNNLFNTPQFDEPRRALTSPNFGRINNTLNDGRSFRFLLRFQF